MSATVSLIDILRCACNEFGMSMSEARAIIKAPTHPRGLRDEFAAKAMQGMVAHPKSGNWTSAEIALDAYTQADAMLKAREAN